MKSLPFIMLTFVCSIYADWAIANKSTISFNAIGDTTEILYQIYDARDGWTNNCRTTFTYDSAHRLIEQLRYNWRTTWEIFDSLTFSYNNTGKYYVSSYYYLLNNSNKFEERERDTFYITNNILDSVKSIDCLSPSVLKYVYAYNNLLKPIKITYLELDSNKLWQPNIIIEYKYTSSGLLDSLNMSSFENGIWSTYLRSKYEYNSSNQLITKTTWENQERITFEYQPSVVIEIMEIWNPNTSIKHMVGQNAHMAISQARMHCQAINLKGQKVSFRASTGNSLIIIRDIQNKANRPILFLRNGKK